MSLVNITTSESGIVKEGLQVWLDSNVNSSLPPSSASPTTWYDLSLNNRYATLYPTSVDDVGDFGEVGPIYFNGGSGKGGSLNYSLPVLQSTDSFTWSILIYLPSGNYVNDVIFGNRYDAVGASGIEFVKFTPTNFEYYSSGSANTSYTIPTNKFHHLCVTKNGTSFVYYDNGEVVNTKTTSKNLTGANPFYFGTGNSSRTSENAEVTFYQVLLYDIGLSEDQVQQNFNTFRGRYGI
jgi:hypothetical protein